MQTTLEQKLFNLPCQEFFITVASNPELLSKGYEIVYKYLSISSNHRESVLLNLLSEKAPVLTLVTRTYPVVYADQTVGITNEQKMKTKEYLILKILFKKLICNFNKQKYATKKNLNTFLLFLIHFHNNEGFEGWVPYYQKLLEQLININSELIGFVLIQILKSSDDRVSCFSKHILSFIINNQTILKISEQQSIQIIYYAIKSMAYLNGTDDEALEQYFQPFEEKILAYIFSSFTKSINIMKFSLKILTVFAADYEIELQKEMINKIRECAKQLIVEHFNSRIASNQKLEQDDLEQDQNKHTSISLILYQLIQLFQTLLSVEQIKMADFQIYLAVCLPSLLLSKAQYTNYDKSTQTYLTVIQDEAQKNLRNKVVSFLLQLYEGEYPSKTKGKMQAQVLKYTLLIQAKSVSPQQFCLQTSNFFTSLQLSLSLTPQHIPLMQQSLTFLLYHLTEQILTFDTKNLQSNKQSLLICMGKNIQQAQSELIKVAYLNLLNKLIKSMNKGVKEGYYAFLIEKVQKIKSFQRQKGFLLSVCRGIAYVSSDVQLVMCQNNTEKGISVQMIQNLVKYLLDTNTLQQSAHLILQFLLNLLKKCSNAKQIMKALIPSQIQVQLLSTHIHDGMIAEVVIDLLGFIASQQFITYIYTEFIKGNTKQQNLSSLIAKWVSLALVQLTQQDIKQLLIVYKNAFVSKIVKEYLKAARQSSYSMYLQTVDLLNQKIHPSWILPMIGCSILRNPQALFINTVYSITYQLTSQYEIENNLLIPYYTLMNDPAVGISILRSHSPQIFDKFFQKLIRYAALFQGSNLKVITSIVLLNICEIDPSKTMPVIELISSYGNSMSGEQWEDENQKDNQENVIDKMFNMKMTNDQVQAQFLEIFGGRTFDMELVNSKVNKLTSNM